MASVTRTALPDSALLEKYQSQPGCYTDCYSVAVDAAVSLESFVYAFYTTWLFKVERQLLRLAGRPSTDDEARALAAWRTDTFAAWKSEERSSNQILLSDYAGRTRSWLMVKPGGSGTRLYFGSAVVPSVQTPNGQPRLSALFRLLLGFHKLYSRALLSLSARRLRAECQPPG